MKIYFCPECGSYSLEPATNCHDCQTQLTESSGVEISEEELAQFHYIDEFELPPGLAPWEYDVIRLNLGETTSNMSYIDQLLNRMGQSGWELVSIVSLTVKDEPKFAVFKRSWIPDFEE